MYVWIDALTNYLTGSGWADGQDITKTWPANMHVLGKDIARFHCIYWIAFLMAADIPEPSRLYVHGWWTKDKQKISKSLGNAFDPLDALAQYGNDTLRYYLLREATCTADGDISAGNIVQRLNADLNNVLGNLVMRLTSETLLPGKVTPPLYPECLTLADKNTIDRCNNVLGQVDLCMADVNTQRALTTIFSTLAGVNEYMQHSAPWKLDVTVEEQRQRRETVLYIAMEGVRLCATCLLAFIPDSAAKILDVLAVPAELRVVTSKTLIGQMQGGLPIESGVQIFSKMDMPEAEKGKNKGNKGKQQQKKKGKKN
ncbi:methionyl-tRNA synthetase [Kipferlia bialata]|uniref:methionine--tRNA ligase n=1 Tax=Kipferlia bialata TaxID=797122 RepID=A0A9K3CYJ5_9EUKA|nr:methionyl-tRNA synthetase [Kipferlia bialata]|eukprot:g6383.t1